MPSSERYEKCSAGEKKQIIKYFNQRFGIPEEVLEKYKFLKKGKNVWIFSGDLEVVSDFKNIETIGIKLLSITRGKPKPTTTAIQVIGKHAQRNIVELESLEDMVEFMTGGVIKKRFEVEPGYVIVKFRGDILGCGLYTVGGELISQVPKSRRIDRRWILED